MSHIKKLQELEDLIKIQCDDGNWDYDPYMHGMANGMILALSVLKGDDPNFLEAPDLFISDAKLLDKFTNSSTIVDTKKK